VGGETEVAFAAACARDDPWWIGELAWLRRLSGGEDGEVVRAAEPYALLLAGEWERAVEYWTELDCPYEAAFARAEGDEPSLRAALAELQRLGAYPAAQLVAARLRERGVRAAARAPRAATRANPAQLTSREVEVLRLVATGLRNAEIASRLVVSPKTVEHHVSAILRKLGVRSRHEAVTEAQRLGLG
jgi:DNA-binding CsgD family transcriptional regulator